MRLSVWFSYSSSREKPWLYFPSRISLKMIILWPHSMTCNEHFLQAEPGCWRGGTERRRTSEVTLGEGSSIYLGASRADGWVSWTDTGPALGSTFWKGFQLSSCGTLHCQTEEARSTWSYWSATEKRWGRGLTVLRPPGHYPRSLCLHAWCTCFSAELLKSHWASTMGQTPYGRTRGCYAVSLDSASVLIGPEKALPPEDGSLRAPQRSALTCCPGRNPFPHGLRRREVGQSQGNLFHWQISHLSPYCKKTLEVRS